MKPPPPRLPANGYVTASANAVATAASTAFPPFPRMLAPRSDAMPDAETTRPLFDRTTAPAVTVWLGPADTPVCDERFVHAESSRTKRAVVDLVTGSARQLTPYTGFCYHPPPR